jgi:hypothetical protein
VVAEKVEQAVGLATAGAQVDVRQEDGANLFVLHEIPATVEVAASLDPQCDRAVNGSDELPGSEAR